jgi:hypothetical protein
MSVKLVGQHTIVPLLVLVLRDGVLALIWRSISVLAVFAFSASFKRICTSFTCFSFRAFERVPRSSRDPVWAQWTVRYFKNINRVHHRGQFHTKKHQSFNLQTLKKTTFLWRFSMVVIISYWYILLRRHFDCRSMQYKKQKFLRLLGFSFVVYSLLIFLFLFLFF